MLRGPEGFGVGRPLDSEFVSAFDAGLKLALGGVIFYARRIPGFTYASEVDLRGSDDWCEVITSEETTQNRITEVMDQLAHAGSLDSQLVSEALRVSVSNVNFQQRMQNKHRKIIRASVRVRDEVHGSPGILGKEREVFRESQNLGSEDMGPDGVLPKRRIYMGTFEVDRATDIEALQGVRESMLDELPEQVTLGRPGPLQT